MLTIMSMRRVKNTSVNVCRQVVGEDFHATVIIGAENLKTEAEDFGIDAEWAQTEGKPHGNAAAGTPLDPTAVVINSQHVWRATQAIETFDHFGCLGSTLSSKCCEAGRHARPHVVQDAWAVMSWKLRLETVQHELHWRNTC